MPTYTCTAELWLYPSESGAWHFVTVPKPMSHEIRALRAGKPRVAWGSVPVTVTIGSSTWNTSLFPSKQAGAYILPVKASVRTAERLHVGDTVSVSLTV